MKLRNKKTGELGYLLVTKGLERYDIIDDNYRLLARYDFLVEVTKDWEDYTTKEPLIKDEKIRKAVRAWAEAIKINGAKYNEFWRAFRFDNCMICFKGEYCFSELEDGKIYTITELCGEDEK